MPPPSGPPSWSVDLASFTESIQRLREIRSQIPETERNTRMADAARMAAQLAQLGEDTELPPAQEVEDDRLYCSICMSEADDGDWVSTLE